MAANREWILSHEGPGTRVTVWAHNGHVTRSSDGWFESMGSDLAKALGSRYAAIGQFFHRGELRAWDIREKDREKLSVLPIDVGPAPKGSVGDALNRIGLEHPFLSLSARSGRLAKRWIETPHLVREVSALYSGEEEQGNLTSLPSNFDAIVFLRTVTATEAKPTGLRGPNSR